VKVGILTGGGDCPGLNAVIRAVARRSFTRGHEVAGVREGWRGLVDGTFEPLGGPEISGLLPRGGTILGTSRTNPYKVDGGVEAVLATFEKEGLDALVAIGGEDTLGVAARLHAEHDFPVVGVPKTIDNDLSGTDYTFGFDTAVYICTEAIDRLHTTAESHNRVMVLEVMGRHTGWIAVVSGIEGGGGEEGDVDQFGHARLSERGIGARVAHEIEQRTGFETRVTVLGHVQRGGSPTPRDRVLATRYGLKAADLVHEQRFGRMAALRGDSIVDVSLDEATAQLKTVPEDWYDVARAFFG
jgi:6-phosphofructokinase